MLINVIIFVREELNLVKKLLIYNINESIFNAYLGCFQFWILFFYSNF